MRSKIREFQAFLVVARERSFTKAAAALGVTPSALSHSMRGLEEKLGLRLLTRTTRNVAPTQAGEQLMHSLEPLFEQISAEIEALSALRDKPAGTIRLSCTDDQIGWCLRPMLSQFLSDYPDIRLELYVDHKFTDIIEERLDAGIRIGEAIAKDMIAVRISPDWRLVVVGSPAYFVAHPPPTTPHDLTLHKCINSRYRPSASIYIWEFAKDGREFSVKTNGNLVFNSIIHVLNAALDGIGLAYVPEYLATPYLVEGRLTQVLADWCPEFPGYHLYYPNRRQNSPAFSAFVEALRYKG